MLLAITALVGGAAPALAQKSADTLRISWREAVLDPDPYHNPLRNGLVLAHQVFDGLISRDPETFALRPLLALSWKYTDDTTLEFELRPGVMFHNGERFTADDVVYTVQQALTDPLVAVPSNYAWLAGAEKIDDLHVRIKLKQVFPAALEYMALAMPILPSGYRTRGGVDAFSKAPVGTGPYKITEVTPLRIALDRNEDYFAQSPKGRPAIAHIVIRQVADAAAELDDLIGGKADWIWSFAPEKSAQIAANPALQEQRAESMRIGYLSIDAAGRTDPYGPLTSLKVRQAIALAIDRPVLGRALLAVGARVPDAPCFPTQFGCDPNAAERRVFDPVRARQLLAEAGFPDGFDTELVSYVLPQYAEGVSANLAAIGIRARVSQLPLAQAITRAAAGNTPLFMGSWGSYSINDVSAILPYFFGGGENDYARNAEVEGLIQQAGATTSADKRRQLYSRALRMISDQAYWLPLHTYVTTYGFSRGLNFKPTTDELPRFYLSSWR
jgi:peptide/nickel transport system substrate-binding protein